jgi:hypothetical protein
MSQETKSYIGMIVPMLVTMAVAGVAGWLLLRYALPQYYFPLYPAIPAYFMVLGLVMSIIMWYYSKQLSGRKIVNVYMMMRGVKLLLTLGGILLYYIVIKEQMMEFGLTVAIFYLVYLFVETYLYYRFEKRSKQIG